MTVYEMMSRIPNLVIIGAQKAGTTSLHQYLRRHPDIFMSHPIKEPGYFMKDKFVLRLFDRIGRPVASKEEVLQKYMLRGFKGEKYFGEASTYYTLGQQSALHGVPARMKRADPGMKLIYLVRNPLDRLVSHFLHVRQTGLFHGDLAAFMESSEYKRGFQTSCYWQQLAAYLEEFPKAQIHVALFEDLATRAQGVVDTVCEFLGLQRIEGVTGKVYNRSETRSSMDAAELVFPRGAYRRMIGQIKADVVRLADFMERDLDIWDLSEDRWCQASARVDK